LREVKFMEPKLLAILFFAWISLLNSGCSVFMAANQPSKKDTHLFSVGTPRNMLLAEFGPPAVSEIKDGKKHEIFTFVQGYSTGTKIARTLFHGTADIFSVGLWEVVGTPTEMVFHGNEMAYEVIYDENDRVDQVLVLRKK
jgi:hypothetical protein